MDSELTYSAIISSLETGDGCCFFWSYPKMTSTLYFLREPILDLLAVLVLSLMETLTFEDFELIDLLYRSFSSFFLSTAEGEEILFLL
jgi:hypothetical protein